MKELLINIEPMESRVAVLEDNVFEEFQVERRTPPHLLGNIYKGKVASIVPGIRAAFVDMGLGKNGFLYLTDIVELTPDVQEAVRLEGGSGRRGGGSSARIQDLVRVGQELLVQVIKEPLGTKGPRLTTHLTLPGRFLVLMPLDPTFGISKRIDEPKERERLRGIFKELQPPKDVGVIVRTVAAGATQKQLAGDLRFLLSLWKRVKGRSGRVGPLSLVHEEYDLPLRIVRDTLTEDYNKIIVDSKDIHRTLMRFLAQTEPNMRSRVELYKHETPLFEKRGLEREIEQIYNRKVELPSGGHVVIEQTESLVAIDVNSGKFTGRRNLEETAFVTNMEAAKEIPRQIRLRDLGGIIIQDFIDMDSQSHRQRVFNALQTAVKKDRAKTNLMFLSEFGLVEMTRQRVRRSLESVSFHECPSCQGRGIVRSPLTVSIGCLRKIKRAFQSSRKRVIEVTAHPDLAARLLNEDRSLIVTVERQYRGKVVVKTDPALHLENFQIQPV
ncbi:MAG: hypothetical protein COV76_05080 [Candidatus Omnitrophica bacterium CG11_big_fil_rev_8_21_14_0_20_64_10]|nr:MAG: hypothetical protein COV76_05080 [Candidatus Omnitrophica bacterium CG11_big_fil_rev_8_21_14_0_20_64_10]